MKRTALLAIIFMVSIILISSCGTKNLPTAPQITATPVQAPLLGSISGTVQLKTWVCPPCNPLPGGPIVFNTATPGGPTPTPWNTPVPVPTATVSYSGAVVKAYLNGVEKAFTVTDINGNYKLSNLAPGFYNLQVTFPQYDVDNSMQNITVTAGADTANQDLIKFKWWAPGKLEVSFKDTVTDAQARVILASYGCTIDIAYTNNPAFLFYFISIPYNKTPPQMVTILNADPAVNVSSVESYACACPA
jgi:hypothetical protein